MTMSPRVRKLALTAHVASSVGWLGAVLVYIVLAITGLTSRDPQLARAAFITLKTNLHSLADNKDAFMARLRESEPERSDEDAEEMYATHLEFLKTKGARVVMDQTTLVRDSLELASEIEDVLA